MDEVLDLALERKLDTQPALAPEGEQSSGLESAPLGTDQEPLAN
jgi:hypothetical protein